VDAANRIGYCMALMMQGNTVIVKPSEKVPITMRYVMELLKEAGVPAGVVQCLHGSVESTEV
jgi:malonate-semialdehyde dehydrogenase (acetylating) / methylmalonate-semialdehyde dehydrogenase